MRSKESMDLLLAGKSDAAKKWNEALKEYTSKSTLLKQYRDMVEIAQKRHDGMKMQQRSGILSTTDLIRASEDLYEFQERAKTLENEMLIAQWRLICASGIPRLDKLSELIDESP